jgi:hypothetical protein
VGHPLVNTMKKKVTVHMQATTTMRMTLTALMVTMHMQATMTTPHMVPMNLAG